jgi:hypothetical protein
MVDGGCWRKELGLICYEVPTKSHEADDLNGIKKNSINYESRRGCVVDGWRF